MVAPLKVPKTPQGDLFVCDITDAILKDDMSSMEHPFYSLSKKPDREPRRYEKNGKWIEFRPSIKGLPTIYDKDLIIYAISQLMAGKKEGRAIAKTVEIDPYAFLIYTERGTGGRDYEALCDSLDRLDGTRFRTNILFEGTRKDKWVGIIDSAELETDEVTRKPRKLRITLSDMVIDAVESMQVLTLHRNYFRLRKPIERRVYELARKHCGQQPQWECSLSTLHMKSGSKSSLREFRRAIKHLVKYDHLPDYQVALLDEDKVQFINRVKRIKPKSLGILPPLPTSAYEEAKRAAPAYDIYYLEQEFHSWWSKSGKPPPANVSAAFIGFCRTVHSRKPVP